MSALSGFLIVFILALLGWRTTVIFNLLRNRDVDHAMCISHVSHYVGNEFAASVLRAAAEQYASPDGQHEAKVIANSREYRLDGPPIPSIWLNNRADALIEEVKP